MQGVTRILDAVSNALLAISCVAVGAMMLQVTADAFLRTFIHWSIPGTEEIVSAYYMVAVAFLPLAYVQRERGHVMIELFTMRLPPRANAAIDGIVFIVCGIALAIFTYASVVKAISMTEQAEILIGTVDVTVWPSRWFVPAGCAAMALYMWLNAFKDLAWAVHGGPREQPASPLH